VRYAAGGITNRRRGQEEQPVMLTRRTMLIAPLAAAAARTVSAAPGKMTLAIHQNTSARAGFRTSLEGWARAGIKYVELTPGLLDGFVKTDSLAAAKRLLADLGLTPVCCACGSGVWEPHPERAAALDNVRRRCEMLATLGLPRTYATTATTGKFTLDDYKTGVEHMREVGEIGKQFGLTVMAEFVRTSTFIATLPTLLKMTREAAHPNMRPMLDCYHFWSSNNKFEDLDLLRPGEIAHVHFNDVMDMPRELLDNTTRAIPGDGVTPLVRMLRKLAEKEYAGPLSVELFAPKFQQGDPFQLAGEIKRKAEAVMRQARVL
jgi:sugar phosphate isomerase/epimerase